MLLFPETEPETLDVMSPQHDEHMLAGMFREKDKEKVFGRLYRSASSKAIARATEAKQIPFGGTLRRSAAASLALNICLNIMKK